MLIGLLQQTQNTNNYEILFLTIPYTIVPNIIGTNQFSQKW